MLFLPTYFSPILQYAAILQAKEVQFEMADTFQKQTYRNRCYIYGANGKLLLGVPIKHAKRQGRQMTKDVFIDNTVPWQKRHLKSLQMAYRSSPYFEFYEADIVPIFQKKFNHLTDLNLQVHAVIMDLLQEENNYSKSTEYLKKSVTIKDGRSLVNAKQSRKEQFEEYPQVFSNEHMFIKNLSILDLLFMEGPSASSYLRRLKPL